MVPGVGDAVICVQGGEPEVRGDCLIPYLGHEGRSLVCVFPELSLGPAKLILHLVESLADEVQLGSQGVRRIRRQRLRFRVASLVCCHLIPERGQWDPKQSGELPRWRACLNGWPPLPQRLDGQRVQRMRNQRNNGLHYSGQSLNLMGEVVKALGRHGRRVGGGAVGRR